MAALAGVVIVPAVARDRAGHPPPVHLLVAPIDPHQRAGGAAAHRGGGQTGAAGAGPGRRHERGRRPWQGLDTGHFLTATTNALSGTAAGPATPAFVLFLGGLAVVFGSFLLWIELLVRAAAVYVAVLFLPLALASLAWPAVSHWCRRLVDTLVGLVLSKFVIITVLSLAVSALAGGTNGQGSGGDFRPSWVGLALFLAAAAPWAWFRLLPFAEAAAIATSRGWVAGASSRCPDHQGVAPPPWDGGNGRWWAGLGIGGQAAAIRSDWAARLRA